MDVQVEVRRSRRRRRTVQARRDGDKIVVMVPDNLSRAEERAVVAEMVAKVERREGRGTPPSDEELAERAAALSDRYLGGIPQPSSVRWVSNQRARWGSCTPDAGTIRLSERLQGMPDWVVDYVLVHELVHLIEPGHDAEFWRWVANYPHADKAKGYLVGWSDAQGVERPPSDAADEVD